MPTDDPRNPFISDRSPSYESARREYLDPSPAPDPQLVAMLAELVEIELDLTASYEAAADTAADPILAAACERSSDQHRHRAAALADHLRQLGAAPPEAGDDFPTALPSSAGDVRDLIGDQRLEQAIADNRSFVSQRYRLALQREGLPEDTRALLEQLAQARGGAAPSAPSPG